jgi:hypothetical protein
MGEPRGGVDCSSGDEGHLFIASLTIAKIRRANVALEHDAFRFVHSLNFGNSWRIRRV